MKTEYVAGFLFDDTCEGVLLIEKKKPTWQRWLFNGIGGKIEDGELPEVAMAREFEEETGLTTEPSEWVLFCQIEGADYSVKFYYGQTTQQGLMSAKTVTDEEVHICAPEDLHNWKVIDNLRWLIPLAIDKIKNYSGKIYIP